MPQDAFTLRHLCIELDSLLKNGKINKIIQPSNDEIVLTIYNGKEAVRLLLDVNPASPKVLVLDGEKEAPLSAPNFCMLLRKHLLSATLNSISLIGFDRIIKMDFTHQREFSDPIRKTLYVELMGRYSNVILTENDIVLGGNRGINFFDNGVRPLISGRPYILPPTGDKFTPDDERLIDVIKGFESEDVSYALCTAIQGIASITAKEIVYLWDKQNKGKNIKDFPQEFFEFINEFLYKKTAKPCISFEDGKVKDVFVFPFEVDKGEHCFYDSLYKAESEFFRLKTLGKIFADKKAKILSVVGSQEKKLNKKLSALKNQKSEAENCEEHRIKGELIISNLYRLKQGEESCRLENYYEDGKLIEIALDKALSPSQNAERYFKKYNKQKRTIVAIQPQIDSICEELNYLESVKEETELCERVEELFTVIDELVETGLIKEQHRTKKKKENKPYREYEVCGFIVKAGRNNIENDNLTTSARGEDIWLHAKALHSTHVIIEANRKKVPEEVIRISAEICAYYSKGREEDKTEVVFTEKKNVKKPKRSKAGFCTYENFKSILVKADSHIEYYKDI